MNDRERMAEGDEARRRQDPLRGATVSLRPRHSADIAILHAGLYDDLATRAQGDSRPWIPIPDGPPALSPFAVTSVSDEVSFFSVVTLDEELAGEALLWAIDAHNRCAQVGLALLPEFRGRGLSVDVLRLLCRYGFDVRGLNRLELQTKVANEPMVRAATKAGFVEEGVLRQSRWSLGAFRDELIMGLLADEWHDRAL